MESDRISKILNKIDIRLFLSYDYGEVGRDLCNNLGNAGRGSYNKGGAGCVRLKAGWLAAVEADSSSVCRRKVIYRAEGENLADTTLYLLY